MSAVLICIAFSLIWWIVGLYNKISILRKDNKLLVDHVQKTSELMNDIDSDITNLLKMSQIDKANAQAYQDVINKLNELKQEIVKADFIIPFSDN